MELPWSDPRLPIDSIFAVLSERHRRYALYYLAGQGRPVPLGELVDRLADWERDRPERSAANRAMIERGLAEDHLPELRRIGVVEYDDDLRIAEYDGRLPVLESVLEYTERYERGDR